MNNILDNIGNTPLVRINKLFESKKVNIYAKVEGMNPGGSIKDRVALNMIQQAILTKKLKPGMTVVEATSGNTAIGLAMVCAVLDYQCTLVMPSNVSKERIQICEAYGAEVVSVTGNMDNAIDLAEAYSMFDHVTYYPNQFDNELNWRTHYDYTTPEINEQLGKRITHFVATCGTTGTIRGFSEWFEDKYGFHKPEITGVFPQKNTKIPGLKNLQVSRVPKIYKSSCIDREVYIKDKDAFIMTKRLAKEEGLFCGISSGAAMHIAVQIASKIDEGNIVVILPDNGYRYLSNTSLWV